MCDRLTITLPLRLAPSLNLLLRTHWAKRRRMLREAAWLVAEARLAAGWDRAADPANVRLEVVRRSSRRPDFDNMVGAAKLAIDALVLAGVLQDDDIPHDRVVFRWEHAPRRADSCLVVTVFLA